MGLTADIRSHFWLMNSNAWSKILCYCAGWRKKVNYSKRCWLMVNYSPATCDVWASDVRGQEQINPCWTRLSVRTFRRWDGPQLKTAANAGVANENAQQWSQLMPQCPCSLWSGQILKKRFIEMSKPSNILSESICICICIKLLCSNALCLQGENQHYEWERWLVSETVE